MDLFINISHVVLSILLILVIILQPSKGSDIGAAFGGGGGSSTMFGPRGAGSVLSRATTVVAVLFMVTSISLAMRSVPKGGAGTALSDDAGLEGLDDIDLGLDFDEAVETSTEELTEEQGSTVPNEEEGQQDVEAPAEAAEGDAPPAANPVDQAGQEAGTGAEEEAPE
jgi:preprotein translocase subunit SecG